MKEALFLDAAAGGGHRQIAEVIANELIKLDPSWKIKYVDGLKTNWYDPKTAYLQTATTFGKPFELVYNLTNNNLGNHITRDGLRLAFGKHIRKLIEQHKPKVIVSTHPFISASIIKNYSKLGIPFLSVVTNLPFHRTELDEKADLVFVPTNQWSEYASRFIPKQRLVLSGFPIRSVFKPTSTSARGPILVMGGGLGVGNIKKQVKVLVSAFPDKEILVVAGKNNKLATDLRKTATPNLEVLGFTDKIPELMRRASIVVTKAGPNTIMEAATVGRPLVITGYVGPQEKDNPQFVEENGFGLACLSLDRLPETIERIYRDYDQFIHPEKVIQGGAKKIAQHISSLG